MAYKPGGKRELNIDECRVGSSKRVPGSLSRTPNNIYGAGLGGYRQNGTEGGHNPNLGRWPANLCLSWPEDEYEGAPNPGRDEVLALFPQTTSGMRRAGVRRDASSHGFNRAGRVVDYDSGGDHGSAARFFYCSKASRLDRAGSAHPCIKPQALLEWLVKLVTPPGGTCLDPFAGSGSTAQAALAVGRKPILIEREEQWFADARRRIEGVQAEAKAAA